MYELDVYVTRDGKNYMKKEETRIKIILKKIRKISAHNEFVLCLWIIHASNIVRFCNNLIILKKF